MLIAALHVPGFNPRTHAGCDTSNILHFLNYQSFNPRTHAGCDTKKESCAKLRLCFNPRTHAGCDKKFPDGFHQIIVSIHAPTQGATQLPLQVLQDIVRFNPRTHAGCDDEGRWFNSDKWFQSTHPRRVRRFGHEVHQFFHVSIHAPTQGATRPALSRLLLRKSFNPRTHAGCDSSPSF